MEALFGLALFGESIELLLSFDDLLFRFALHIHTRRFRSDFIAHVDQLSANSEIVDHFGIIAHRKGRDCGAGETHQISGPAQFCEPRVIF